MLTLAPRKAEPQEQGTGSLAEAAAIFEGAVTAAGETHWTFAAEAAMAEVDE